MNAGTQTSISEIEDTLSRKGWRGEFPPEMERLYQEEAGKVRARAVRRALLPTVLIYNLLLLTDISLLPKTAAVAAFLHFAVVTPGLFLLYFLYHRTQGYFARQIVEAAIPVLICLQTLTVLSLNGSANAGYYQYFVPLIMLFSNVNQRFDTRIANATTVLILSMYAAVLWPHALGLEQKFAGVSFTAVACYLGLSANIRFQRDARYGFLMRLRERVRLEAAEIDALHDPMTGLGNRRYLANLAEALASSGRGEAVSVILMDIDFFKAYNDFYGHGRGDDCIKIVAEALEATVRPFDGTAIRYGGEEFLILLSGEACCARAVDCAEAVRCAVAGLKIAHRRSTVCESVTVSLGVASGVVTTPETFQMLVGSADAALYAAKAGGRNRLVCRDLDPGKRVVGHGPPALRQDKKVLH